MSTTLPLRTRVHRKNDSLIPFALTSRGNRCNEDYVGVGSSYGVLLDGASGLGGFDGLGSGYGSGAQWLSHESGALIEDYLQRGFGCRCAANAAYEYIKDCYGENGRLVDGLGLSAVPSSTLAIATVTEDKVSVLWMGDSPVVVVGRRWLDVLVDSEVGSLDKAALGIMRRRCDALGVPLSKGSSLIQEVLKANRSLRNKPGGYRIFDPADGSPDSAGYREYAREDVLAVIGMSDGMYAAFETYGICELDVFCRNADLEFANWIIARMREVEQEDSSLDTYPRFKVSDDASLFYVPVAGVSGSQIT